MKKLFSLVLALALALAIAAPALASGWDEIKPDPVATGNIKVEVIPLDTKKTEEFGGGYYKRLSAAELGPIVKGALVHFLVVITIPDSLTAADLLLLQNKGLDYKLTLKNLELVDTADIKGSAALYNYKTGVDTLYASDPIVRNKTAANFQNAGGADWTNRVITYEYWAAGKADGEARAVADIGFNNKWVGNQFVRFNAEGRLVFTVNVKPDAYFDIVDPNGNVLAFPVTSMGKIDDSRAVILKINYGSYAGGIYSVSRATALEIAFAKSLTENASGAELVAIRTIFDGFFAALGFGYTSANYMQTEHFEKYFGAIKAGDAFYAWPAGTVTAVVVAPPAVQPPQTGDATTAVGFVMIALALVAAAAVTLKKVRA